MTVPGVVRAGPKRVARARDRSQRGYDMERYRAVIHGGVAARERLRMAATHHRDNFSFLCEEQIRGSNSSSAEVMSSCS